MKKHVRIKAASCLDMINAFNSKIHELDPGYVASSETINASDDGFYSDADMESIDRNGSDEELAISAISYFYGISVAEARKEYETINQVDLQRAIGWYLDRGLPTKERLARSEELKNKLNASCDTDCKEEVTAEEYIHGAENRAVDEEYVDEMMQYVADETISLDPPAVCSWHVKGDNLVFVLAGDEELVDEYTCPLEDLTGDVDTDVKYICDAINGGTSDAILESTEINADSWIDSGNLDDLIRNMFDECADNAEPEEYTMEDFIDIVSEHVEFAIEDDEMGVNFKKYQTASGKAALSRKIATLCKKWIKNGEGPEFAHA